MTGFEPRTSCVGSNRSTNCATTTSQQKIVLRVRERAKLEQKIGAQKVAFSFINFNVEICTPLGTLVLPLLSP